MYNDDLHVSDNEQNFKWKSSSHRREISSDWDDDKYPIQASLNDKSNGQGERVNSACAMCIFRENIYLSYN